MKKIDPSSGAPIRQESTDPDSLKKLHEQNGMDIKYQEELSVHLERKKHLRENTKKLTVS